MGQQVIQTSLGSMVYYTPIQASTTSTIPFLFLHGFGGGASAYEWSKVYPAFLETHPVLVPDLIGWGQSAHPIRDYQVSDYLDTIYEFIQQTCSSPVTIVAASLTGAIAIRLAIQHPELFQSLFLVCPSGFADFGQDAGRRLPLPLINTAQSF
jgi:pimeloyl-ACP methyl ester carboxylesterase